MHSQWMYRKLQRSTNTHDLNEITNIGPMILTMFMKVCSAVFKGGGFIGTTYANVDLFFLLQAPDRLNLG
jgi:hypothetical protein